MHASDYYKPLDDAGGLWERALIEIGLSVSKANFSTWFKNTAISKKDEGVIILSVPNAFVKDWLSNKFHKHILRALRNIAPEVRSIEYIIAHSVPANREPVGRIEPPVLYSEQLRMSELDANHETGLNPKYVFNSFVVGPFNELAHSAAQAVIKNPGVSYNPLFIYAGTGLGKTHLIQAIGNQIKKTDPGKSVYYLTSEKFTLDYIESVQNNKMYLFKEKYRKYDCLIMDDIQFVAGKERTQEELFHLFNNLYNSNKQIIFSSDKAPKYITSIESRLRSRFEGGMIVDISHPDFESRFAILKSKLKELEFAPSDAVVEYIASAIQDNIRELEGALNSVICQSQLKRRNLNVQEIKTLIKNNIKPKRTISVKEVIKTVAQFYNIEERSLYEKTRRKEIVKPRQVIMYILREDFNTSYPYIGQKLGGRDHTTVIHAYEKIKKDLRGDSLLVQELDQIKILLNNAEPVGV